MKKWILIGLIVLAVSAIAATKIRNSGISLDNYFNVNSSEIQYNISTRASSIAPINYTIQDTNDPGKYFSYRVQSAYYIRDRVHDDDYSTWGELKIDGEDANLYVKNFNNEIIASVATDNYGYASLRSILGGNMIASTPEGILLQSANIQIDTMTGAGNGFLCVNSTGHIYRSGTACV